MKNYQFAKLVVRGFPTIQEIKNPYIYTSDVRVVINVSEHAYPKEIIAEFESRGIRMFHYPLVEEGPDMGIDNILQAVKTLWEADAAGEKVILHCTCGNNRSRTVAEAFYFAKAKSQFEDEYKGFPNHLIFNCESGHLPSIGEIEQTLSSME